MLELRKVTATLSAIGSALFLSACSDALSCSSNEAKQLVIDITKQHYGTTPASTTEADKLADKYEINYYLVDIRTEEESTKPQSVTCAAAIRTESFITKYIQNDKATFFRDVPLNKKTLIASFDKQVTYKLEKTSDGKLYATVHGL